MTYSSTRRWRSLIVACVLLAILASVSIMAGSPSAGEGAGPPPVTPMQKSEALADPARSLGTVVLFAFEPADVPAVAAAYSDDVPLPPGLNSASSLAWARQDQGARLSSVDIHTLLQHNAIGDWITYAARGAQLTEAERAIIGQLPDWFVVRGTSWAEDILRPMVQSILSGDLSSAKQYAEGRQRMLQAAGRL
jgi:hypothetical protein